MDVRHVVKLANLQLSSKEEPLLAKAFADTLKTVDLINELDTSGVSPTYQVTGLNNISRPDTIETSRIIPREKLLGQVKHTPNGLIIVPPVFNESQES